MDIYFAGAYNCKADAKGRVMLPVAIRNQLAAILGDGFFIKKSYYDECLEFYPAQEWNTVMAELNAKLRYDRKNLDFIRKFTSGLRQVEIDASGRLLIPKSLVTLVGITKDVVLAPMGKYIEFWDKATYDKVVDATPEEKEKLANEVMLGKKPEGDVS